MPKVFEWNKKSWNLKQVQNWRFDTDFFSAIIKVSFRNPHTSYQFFSEFKKHIEESWSSLDKIKDQKQREEIEYLVERLFATFFPIFFNEIDKIKESSIMWQKDFPETWKIAVANKDNPLSDLVLNQFFKWV